MSLTRMQFDELEGPTGPKEDDTELDTFLEIFERFHNVFDPKDHRWYDYNPLTVEHILYSLPSRKGKGVSNTTVQNFLDAVGNRKEEKINYTASLFVDTLLNFCREPRIVVDTTNVGFELHSLGQKLENKEVVVKGNVGSYLGMDAKNCTFIADTVGRCAGYYSLGCTYIAKDFGENAGFNSDSVLCIGQTFQREIGYGARNFSLIGTVAEDDTGERSTDSLFVVEKFVKRAANDSKKSYFISKTLDSSMGERAKESILIGNTYDPMGGNWLERTIQVSSWNGISWDTIAKNPLYQALSGENMVECVSNNLPKYKAWIDEIRGALTEKK